MHTNFLTSYSPPAATLAIEGELDVLSRGRLAWRLLDLEALPCDVVRLDVGLVSHVDGGCLRLVDDTRQRLADRGARLEVVDASLCFLLVSRVAGFAVLATAAEEARRQQRTPARATLPA